MRRVLTLLMLSFFIQNIYSQVSSLPGFTKARNGIDFITLKKGPGGKLINGYYASIDYLLYTKDTVIYNSYSRGGPHITRYDSIDAREFSFNTLLQFMTIGDSTLFIISSDSIFKGKEMPWYMKNNSSVFYTVKLQSQQSKNEFETESKKQQDLMNILANKEINDLNQFIKENKISNQPEPSGIYYIEKKKGKGVQPVKGNTVWIFLKCSLISGKEIYRTCFNCKPLDYALGSGKFLKGVEEGLYMMHAGGKARLILPSALAYGAAGYQTVPSYSTLIIDIELVDVK